MTPVGKGMLRIPAHPRISRMLVAANEARVLPEAAILAALIEERDILPVSLERRGRGFGPPRSGPSDLLARKDLFEEAEREGFRRGPEGLDLAAARMVARTRDVILRAAREALAREHRAESPRRLGGEECLLRVLLCAYPDRVARRRAKGSDRARMVGGRGVVLSAASIVRDDPFFLAIDLDDGAAAEARVDLASAVERSWIEEDLAPLVREVVETRFDEEAAKVRSTAALSYRDLPLEEPRERRPPPEEAERLLAEAVRVRAEGIFAASDSAAGWLARVRFLAAHLPELGLPAFDSARLGEILASSCAERTSVAQVAASDLLGLLRSTLSRGQIEALEIQAPESLRVPSGSRIRLRYEGGRPPVLAVRLQEMFGLAETPRVAAGRVPVLLHLLGPNYRPVQITQDLRSFWERTYAQVRKDLRARYPKHAWPEDPWSATPDAPGRRRKSP
jgi:ATP-dependent helicase HrpB